MKKEAGIAMKSCCGACCKCTKCHRRSNNTEAYLNRLEAASLLRSGVPPGEQRYLGVLAQSNESSEFEEGEEEVISH